MKKRLILMFLSFITIFISCKSSNNDLAQPETNLEFWIGENVDRVDFSEYKIKYGIQGGVEYYGTGYVPALSENNEQIDPKECVIYTVTSFPDYSNKEQHVTSIYITDPNIYFYDISLDCSFEMFEYRIEQYGFEIKNSDEFKVIAELNKYTVTYTKEWIRISVKVENKNNIIF